MSSTRQVDRQKALVRNGVETCRMRSATDGRLEYPIGKDEARESLEMSTPVRPATASTSTMSDGHVCAPGDHLQLHRVESSSESSRMQLLFVASHVMPCTKERLYDSILSICRPHNS